MESGSSWVVADDIWGEQCGDDLLVQNVKDFNSQNKSSHAYMWHTLEHLK